MRERGKRGIAWLGENGVAFAILALPADNVTN